MLQVSKIMRLFVTVGKISVNLDFDVIYSVPYSCTHMKFAAKAAILPRTWILNLSVKVNN